MAWINTITELDAKGELKRLYKKVTEPWGGSPQSYQGS